MITCKQSTEWVIKSEHGMLAAKKRLQLEDHLQNCPYCRTFAEQNRLITRAIQKNESSFKKVLSEDEKKELVTAIETKIKNV